MVVGKRSASGAPLVRPRPPELRFSDLQWEQFQRLCVDIARSDGYTHVEVYGRPGQRQLGIDIHATAAGLKPSVYQARRIKRLTAVALRRAVATYITEGHVFDAERFVLCVACPTDDTRVVDELAHVRADRAPLEIELYGSEALSRILRSRPQVVAEFFGDDTAKAFCIGIEHVLPLDADALLRGPVEALGLQDAVHQAQNALANEPAVAAARFTQIADRLAERYPREATAFELRAATATRAAGDHQAAFDALFDLALREIWDRSEPRLSPSLAHELKESAAQIDAVRQQRYRLVSAWERWQEDTRARAVLAEVFDGLSASGDLHVDRAAVLLCEASVADRDFSMVEPRFDELLARSGPLETVEQIRLRAALADVRGRSMWDALYEGATGRRWPAAVSAYLAQRAARWYAWGGDALASERAYRRAIELASAEGLDLDVESALWSLVALYTRFHPQLGNRELFRVNAMALSVDGSRAYMPRHRRTRERALREIADPKSGPEAHMWLRHELWEALVGGDISAEFEALRDLGALYARSGFGLEAVTTLLLAGEEKMVSEVAAAAPSWIDVRPHLQSPTPWIRSAALRLMVVQSDRVPDAVATQILPILIEEIRSGRDAESASEAAGLLADRLPSEDVRKLIDAFRPLAPRNADQYRATDRGLWEFVGRSYGRNSELRAELADLLAATIVGDGIDSRLAMAVRRCAIDPGPLVRRLREAADGGSGAAVTFLAPWEPQHPAVRMRHEQRLQMVLGLQTGPRERHSLFVNYALPPAFVAGLDGSLRTSYANKLMAIARDEDDFAVNRASALDAIENIAGVLEADDRARLFSQTRTLVEHATLSAIERAQARTNHPLSRTRLDFGDETTIRLAALEAAARLVERDEDRDELGNLALGLLHDPAYAAAGSALFVLAEKGFAMSVADLAVSPVAALRQVAAALWCLRPGDAEIARALARDAEQAVRRELASGLTRAEENVPQLVEELRALLKQDVSAEIRSIAVG